MTALFVLVLGRGWWVVLFFLLLPVVIYHSLLFFLDNKRRFSGAKKTWNCRKVHDDSPGCSSFMSHENSRWYSFLPLKWLSLLCDLMVFWCVGVILTIPNHGGWTPIQLGCWDLGGKWGGGKILENRRSCFCLHILEVTSDLIVKEKLGGRQVRRWFCPEYTQAKSVLEA